MCFLSFIYNQKLNTLMNNLMIKIPTILFSFTPMILNFKRKQAKRSPGTRNIPMNRYFGDGSGRDSYITYNYGGVVKNG